MKKKPTLLFYFLLLLITNAYSRQTDSVKVLIPEISKIYKGDSKNGLADGKGVAKGDQDTYVGEFKNGLPEGKGKYTYKNGNTYTGFWKNGLKNGKGEFKYSVNGTSFTQKGYWLNGDYSGPNDSEEPYAVTKMTYVDSYDITKKNDTENTILLSVLCGDSKYFPENFHIEMTSGKWQAKGKKLFISNYTYPVSCDVSFTITAGGMVKQCYFSFEILKEGQYEVVLHTS
jgi:hypothetical protein